VRIGQLEGGQPAPWKGMLQWMMYARLRDVEGRESGAGKGECSWQLGATSGSRETIKIKVQGGTPEGSTRKGKESANSRENARSTREIARKKSELNGNSHTQMILRCTARLLAPNTPH
jgi:hypothetical protein